MPWTRQEMDIRLLLCLRWNNDQVQDSGAENLNFLDELCQTWAQLWDTILHQYSFKISKNGIFRKPEYYFIDFHFVRPYNVS
jgi:hypothetical protein